MVKFKVDNEANYEAMKEQIFDCAWNYLNKEGYLNKDKFSSISVEFYILAGFDFDILLKCDGYDVKYSFEFDCWMEGLDPESEDDLEFLKDSGLKFVPKEGSNNEFIVKYNTVENNRKEFS